MNNKEKYFYDARVLRVVDGDTVDMDVDLGFHTRVKKRVRLYGINAPETRMDHRIRTKSARKKSKLRGLAAKKRLEEICRTSEDEICLSSRGLGKYGRVLGILYVRENDELCNINDLLVSEKLAEKL